MLWPALEALNGGFERRSTVQATASALQTRVVTTDRHSILKLDMQTARVVAQRTLTAKGEPTKNHIEIELPSGTFYRADDYLTVLPTNPRENILRALRRFRLPVTTPDISSPLIITC